MPQPQELPPFAVTWDYRCPFARNAHEHLLDALEGGAPWDVTFVPFSLSQAHVAEGGTPVWDDPSKERDLLAPAAAVVVRDRYPDHFLAVHRALFSARHDEALDLREADVLRDVLSRAGAPADDILNAAQSADARKQLRLEHEWAVSEHGVWGVPTFIVGDRAVFIRLMTRPGGDAPLARRTIERVVRLMEDAPELNEFKEVAIER